MATKRTTQQVELARLPHDTVVRVVAIAVREHKLNAKWTSIGKLIDLLSSSDTVDAQAATQLCEWMHTQDRVTRSCFIDAFMRMYHDANVRQWNKISGECERAPGLKKR